MPSCVHESVLRLLWYMCGQRKKMPCASEARFGAVRYTNCELCKPYQHGFGRIFGSGVYRNKGKGLTGPNRCRGSLKIFVPEGRKMVQRYTCRLLSFIPRLSRNSRRLSAGNDNERCTGVCYTIIAGEIFPS